MISNGLDLEELYVLRWRLHLAAALTGQHDVPDENILGELTKHVRSEDMLARAVAFEMIARAAGDGVQPYKEWLRDNGRLLAGLLTGLIADAEDVYRR